jgi:heme exporter protein D
MYIVELYEMVTGSTLLITVQILLVMLASYYIYRQKNLPKIKFTLIILGVLGVSLLIPPENSICIEYSQFTGQCVGYLYSPFIVMLCVAYFFSILLFTPAYFYQKYQYLKDVQREKERKKRLEKNFQRAVKLMERIDKEGTAFLDDITEDEEQK